MTNVGCFSEMKVFHDSGSVHEHIIEKVNYDKQKMIRYLSSFKVKAGCPREAIDCVTGKVIAPSFLVYNDGEFCWCDFLIYHIKNYNIALPQRLIEKANATLTA